MEVLHTICIWRMTILEQERDNSVHCLGNIKAYSACAQLRSVGITVLRCLKVQTAGANFRCKRWKYEQQIKSSVHNGLV
jgi:hypothetical protein